MRRHSQAIPVSKEENSLALAFDSLGWFDPLTPPRAFPQTLHEAQRTSLYVSSIVLTHNRLNGFGSFIGVVKWNRGHIVVQNVSFNDAMEEMAADKAKLAVNRCSSAAGKSPSMRLVVRESWVCVLEVCDRH